MALLLLSLPSQARNVRDSTAKLRIRFINCVNGKPLSFDSIYLNSSGERYNITKLRYYISNIALPGNVHLKEQDNYHLIKQGEETSFLIPVRNGRYSSISFLLGVDSMHNCSGAQTGALDPMNDMFWTWNSGYVIFKMEGRSAASTADLNRIEYHIGGYRFGNNVSTVVNLKLDDVLIINNPRVNEITIQVNLDAFWNAVNNINIQDTPVCSTPGVMAKKIASNFSYMFSIIKPK